MPKFGGAGGNIDYANLPTKKVIGDRSGRSATRGNTAKTRGIGTTSTGDDSGYAGTIKDSSFNEVADQSGWGRS